MSKILGFSAKKQGGKTTATNYIFGSILKDLSIIVDRKIDEKGRLYAYLVTEDGPTEGHMDPLSTDPKVMEMYEKYVWPFVKVYSFAEYLKAFCIVVLGLTKEQIHGTDEQKNTLTKYKWEDMPGVCTNKSDWNKLDSKIRDKYLIYHKKGKMTARKIMQYFGTDICRKMYFNVWVDATINRIQIEQSSLAIIGDIRFPNEVEAVQKAEGKVIRFLRAPFAGQDEHTSETALNDYPLEKYDAVIDNVEMDIPTQNKAVKEQLVEWWGGEFKL